MEPEFELRLELGLELEGVKDGVGVGVKAAEFESNFFLVGFLFFEKKITGGSVPVLRSNKRT